MSKNTAQVYATNPVTVINNDDLVYLAEHGTTDAAITGANLKAASGGITSAQVQKSAFNFATDTGVDGSAYVASLSPAPASLTDGLTVILRAANSSNVAIPTFNLNGLGAKQILSPGSVMASGDISTAWAAVLVYSLSQDAWQLQNPQASTIGAGFNTATGQFNYATDGGTANAYTASNNFYPALSGLPGIPVYLLVSHTNTGASTFAYAGLSAIDIHFNGAPLVGGEMVNGSISSLVYDGISAWHLLNSYLSAGGSVTPADLQNNTYTYTTNVGGSGNDYTATMSPPLASLVDGQRISFRAPMTNTNNAFSSPPATLDVDGLGPHPIFISTAVLSSGLLALAGALQTGLIYYFTYNANAGHWFLENPSTMVTGEFMVRQYWSYAVDAGSPNAYSITIPTIEVDLFGDPNPGTRVVFTTSSPNTGASTLSINGGSPIAIVAQNGSALVGGEITSTSVNEFTYFNASWVLTNSVTGSLGGPFYEGLGGVNSAQTLNALANGSSSFAIGSGAVANASDAVAMCSGSSAGASNAICIGNGTTVNATSGVALGQGAQVYGSGGVAAGVQTTAVGQHSYSLGYNCYSGADFTYTLGNQSTTNNQGSVVWGDSTIIPVEDSIADQFNLTFAGGFRFFLNNVPTAAFAVDPIGNVINSLGTADQAQQYEQPMTGFAITINDGVKTLLLDPAGTLATGTITMPASPVNGQEVRFSSTQIVTALTLSPNTGQSMATTPSAIAAGQGFGFIYRLANTTWYPLY